MTSEVLKAVDLNIQRKETLITNIVTKLEDDGIYGAKNMTCAFEGEGKWRNIETKTLAELERLVREMASLMEIRKTIAEGLDI